MMMKARWIAAVWMAAFAMPCLAQATQSADAVKGGLSSKASSKGAEKAQPRPNKKEPTGPIGIGGIKIGMTRAEIEAIPATEPVGLTGELTPAKMAREKPGEEYLKAGVRLPGANSPLKGLLTFRDGRLIGVQVGLEGESDELLDSLERQIASRYGAAKVVDERTEEDCIYKNGSNFKIKRGKFVRTWSTAHDGQQTVESNLLNLKMTSCPTNLTHGLDRLELKALSVRIKDPEEPPKPGIF